MHLVVEQGEFFQQGAPQIQRPNVAFAVAAGVLLDRFNFALVANSFPDQWLDPVKAVQDDRIKIMLLGLQRADLGQEFTDRFSLWKPCDIELLGSLLGADKDGGGSVGTQS